MTFIPPLCHNIPVQRRVTTYYRAVFKMGIRQPHDYVLLTPKPWFEIVEVKCICQPIMDSGNLSAYMWYCDQHWTKFTAWSIWFWSSKASTCSNGKLSLFSLVVITSLSQCWNVTSLDFPTVGVDNPEGFGCNTSPVVGDITNWCWEVPVN